MKFKAHVFTILCLIFTHLGYSYNKVIFNGTFKFNTSCKLHISALPIYYKGNIYYAASEKDGGLAHFEFLDYLLSTLFILITEQPPLPIGITENQLKLPTKNNFSLFKARKSTLFDTNGELRYSWRIEDVTKDYVAANLPEATIIIFTHPNNIEKIESTSWYKDIPRIPLPSICFKEDLVDEELSDLFSQMQLALMDFKVFHKRPNTNTKLFPNCIVYAPMKKSEFL